MVEKQKTKRAPAITEPQRLLASNTVRQRIEQNSKVPGAVVQKDDKPALKYLIADNDAAPCLPLKIVARTDAMPHDNISALLDRLNSNLTPRTFALCTAFLPYSQTLSESIATRAEFYSGRNSPKLSNILDARAAGSVELAVLAQAALQVGGVESYYVGGTRISLINKERYSYVVIVDKGTPYVWDAANPVKLSSGALLPRIFKMPADFLDRIKRANGPELLKGENIFIRTESGLFGVE